MSAEVNVRVFDTTPRDGAQALPPGHTFPFERKVDIADAIATLGVGVIEAGFPATPPKEDHIGPTEAEQVRAVAESVGQTAYEVVEWRNGLMVASRERAPIIAGLCRADFGDIEKTWNAIEPSDTPMIHTFVSTEDHHREVKFGVSRDELIEMARKAAGFSKSISAGHDSAMVEVSAEAAFHTDFGYLERFTKTIANEGVDVINFPDTLGLARVLQSIRRYYHYIDWVMDVNPDIIISSHPHNDKGKAVANTEALVEAATLWAAHSGQTVNIQVETTVCGVGERAGNADVFPFIASMHDDPAADKVPGIDGIFHQDIYDEVSWRWQFNPWNAVVVARRVLGFAGLEPHRQSPVVGSDVGTHRSGIHSSAVLKGGEDGHKLYTGIVPTEWGHSRNAIHEHGPYQGKAGMAAAQTDA
jgi:2-isopropylmalate synthase